MCLGKALLNMTITDSSDGPPEAVKAELLKLNVAEYQALMSRANQFMSFQLGVWGSTIAFITLVVNQWRETKPHDPAIVWLGGIGVQILLHLASTLVEQQYLLVTYIENNLRHSVVGALPQKWKATSFWRYESFLVGERPDAGANTWGEWAISVPFGLLLIGAAIQWWPTSGGTYALVFINVVLLVGLIVRTPHRIALRRKFAAAFRHDAKT
jgi:hypothetical protein